MARWIAYAVLSVLFVGSFGGNLCYAQNEKFTILKDQAYQANPSDDYEAKMTKVDWYLPKGKKGFPCIIWFHGGALRGGDKADDIATKFADHFSENGIAVASVNYRMSPQVKYPVYLQDSARALAYVHEKIESLGGSKKSVFVSGHSAGGYITMMMACDPKYLEAYGMAPSNFAGFIPVSGQTITHSTVRAERGMSEEQPMIDEAAPSFHVSPGIPPTLCVVGTNDLPARLEENLYFLAAMKTVKNEMIDCLVVPERDHTTIISLVDEQGDPVSKAIVDFVAKYEGKGK